MMNLWTSRPHAAAGIGVPTIAPSITARITAFRIICLLSRPDQLSRRPPVAGIPGIAVAPPPALGGLELRCLEQHRQPAESAIVQEASKRLDPQASLPDVFVSIDAAPARL